MENSKQPYFIREKVIDPKLWGMLYMTKADDVVYPGPDPNRIDDEGITKRELFAMAAMQGILVNSPIGNDTIIMYAEAAVKAADALIKQLNEPYTTIEVIKNPEFKDDDE